MYLRLGTFAWLKDKNMNQILLKLSRLMYLNLFIIISHNNVKFQTVLTWKET